MNMTSLSHALIGAAIAAKIPDPSLVASISVITHFICDAIPHWDLGTNWRGRPRHVTGMLAIAETLVALFGTFFIFRNFVSNQTLLAIGIVFSLLPDWLEAPYYMLLPNPPKIFYYCYKVQSLVHERLNAPWGVLTQAAIVALFMYVGFFV